MFARKLESYGLQMTITLSDLIQYQDLLEEWLYVLMVNESIAPAEQKEGTKQETEQPAPPPTRELADVLNAGVLDDAAVMAAWKKAQTAKSTTGSGM